LSLGRSSISHHWAARPAVGNDESSAPGECACAGAAQTRIVSVARLRLDPRKSVRPFKGIICGDIPEFESYVASHAVVSAEPLECAENSIRPDAGPCRRRVFAHVPSATSILLSLICCHCEFRRDRQRRAIQRRGGLHPNISCDLLRASGGGSSLCCSQAAQDKIPGGPRSSKIGSREGHRAATAQEEVVSLTGTAWHGSDPRAQQQWSCAECEASRRHDNDPVVAPGLLGECWQRYAVAVRRFRTVEATRRMERSCPPRHMICGAP
jgi:hypothetical protein